MDSVAPDVGRSSVMGALASSSGTPVSQIHMKVNGARPLAGSQYEFPVLLAHLQAARWIQVTRESHWSKEKGIQLTLGAVWTPQN